MVNIQWRMVYVNVVVDYKNLEISYHCPLLLKCTSQPHKGGRPFMFFNYMVEREGFDAILTTEWDKAGLGVFDELSLEEASRFKGQTEVASSKIFS